MMESISLKFTFTLENGGSRIETIRDIKPDVTETEVIALANSIIQKGGQYKGSKFTELKRCEKITSSIEIILAK